MTAIATVDKVIWRFHGYPVPSPDGQTYPGYETTWPEEQEAAARTFYDRAANSRSWISCELSKDIIVTVRDVVASNYVYQE